MTWGCSSTSAGYVPSELQYKIVELEHFKEGASLQLKKQTSQ